MARFLVKIARGRQAASLACDLSVIALGWKK